MRRNFTYTTRMLVVATSCIAVFLVIFLNYWSKRPVSIQQFAWDTINIAKADNQPVIAHVTCNVTISCLVMRMHLENVQLKQLFRQHRVIFLEYATPDPTADPRIQKIIPKSELPVFILFPSDSRAPFVIADYSSSTPELIARLEAELKAETAEEKNDK